MSVDLVDLLDSPYQTRKDESCEDEAFVQLKASIASAGMLQPPQVRFHPPGKYQVVFGHRRIRVAKELGWAKVDVDVVELGEHEAALAVIHENLARKDLTEYEMGLAFSLLVEQFQDTQPEIAKAFGINVMKVSNCIRIVNLLNAFANSRVNPVTADEIAELKKNLSPAQAQALLMAPDDILVDLMQRAVRENMSPDEIRAEIQRIIEGRDATTELFEKLRSFERKQSLELTGTSCPKCGKDHFQVRVEKCVDCGFKIPTLKVRKEEPIPVLAK